MQEPSDLFCKIYAKNPNNNPSQSLAGLRVFPCENRLALLASQLIMYLTAYVWIHAVLEPMRTRLCGKRLLGGVLVAFVAIILFLMGLEIHCPSVTLF